MSNLNFNEIPVQENKTQVDNDKPRFMKPGVHKATVTGVTESPEGYVGTPYIQVGFVDSNGATINLRGFTSDAARKWTLVKLKNIIESTEQIVPEQITVDALNKMLTSKELMLKVSGEEVMIDDKQNLGAKIKIVRGVVDGLNPTSSIINNKLTFDATKDIKKLEDSNVSTTDKATNELPF